MSTRTVVGMVVMMSGLVGCGPSSTEIKEARQARYTVDHPPAHQLLAEP